MKILFLTTHIPYPPDSGGKIRSWNFLRYLASKGEVTMVAPGKIAGTNVGAPLAGAQSGDLTSDREPRAGTRPAPTPTNGSRIF